MLHNVRMHVCAQMSTKPLRGSPICGIIWRPTGFWGRFVLMWIFERGYGLNASVSRQPPLAGTEDTVVNLIFSSKAGNSLQADRLWTMHDRSAEWLWTIINYKPSARHRNGHHNIHVSIWLWYAQMFLQDQFVPHREQDMPSKELFLYTSWRCVGWWRHTSCLLQHVINAPAFLGLRSYLTQKHDVTHSPTLTELVHIKRIDLFIIP